jgi:multisubunit Na+/H+ antiporter MnhB subunit
MANNTTFGGSLLAMVQGVFGTFCGLLACGGCLTALAVIALVACLMLTSAGVSSVNADRTATAAAVAGE